MSGHASETGRRELSEASRQSMGRLGRGSMANLAGVVVAAVANFGVTVLVTRSLSRNDAGVFFSATSLFLLAVAIGQLGTQTGLVYFLSRARTLGQTELLRPYLRAARTPVAVAAFLAGGVMLVFAPQIAAWSTPDHVELGTYVLRVLAVFTPFASIRTLNLSASRGMGTMRPTVLVEQIGRPLLQFVLVGVVVVAGYAKALPFAWAVSYVLGAGVARAMLQKRLDAAGPPSARPRRVTGEFWRFTWPRAIANVAQTAMQRFDIVLVAALAGVGPAAIYAASTRFLVLGQLGNRAISLSAQPRLAEALTRGVRKDVNDIYATSTAWLMIATWPVYLLFATVGTPMLRIFGEGYSGGATLLALLSLAMLFATCTGMVDMVINMAGRSWWNLAYVIVAAGTQFGLDVLLIPHYGILGAGIGWAVAIVAQNLFAVVLLVTRRGFHPFGLSTAIVAGVAAVSFGAIPLLVRSALGDDWRTVAVAAVLGSLLYAVLLWVFRRPLHLKALLDVRRRGRRRAAESPEEEAAEETVNHPDQEY